MKADHSDQSEAQGRTGDRGSEGSVERNPWADEQEPNMRQSLRRASGLGITKLSWSKQRECRFGGYAEKVDVLTRGGLVFRLKGRRCKTVRGVSRGHSSPCREALTKDRTIGRD